MKITKSSPKKNLLRSIKKDTLLENILVDEMSITKEVVLKTARLARLHIDDEKVELYTKELSNILDVVDDLKTADTSGVEPLVNVNEFEMNLREDKVLHQDQSEDVLKNAPKEKFGYFVVPRVIE